MWGALGKFLLSASGLGGIGAAATGGAQGAETERQTAAKYQLDRDRLGLDAATQQELALKNREQAEIERRKQTMDSGNNAWKNAMRSALVQNFSPTTRPQGVQNISFVGKGVGAQGQAAAQAMEREAMTRLLEGEKFEPMAAATPYALQSPGTMQGAGTMEKLMGILGLAATGASNARKPPVEHTGLGDD